MRFNIAAVVMAAVLAIVSWTPAEAQTTPTRVCERPDPVENCL